MKVKLSNLVEQIQNTIQGKFDGEYWISAQITNVKKYESNSRCYLTLSEFDENKIKVAEVKGVFWSTYYSEITNFEKVTGQVFKDGIEIVCKVKVKFNKVYGLTVEISQIDVAHTIGSLELERRKTLDRLIKENPTILFEDGVFTTRNNTLPLPMVIKRVALITAPGSDGQRDFIQEIKNNKHNYTFHITEFLTMIQGDNAHNLILEQLKLVEKGNFDVVAIVRGGGSQSDFKPFDEYELAYYVAGFPIPVFTGIGHDRNQSVVDLMAREQKTPTKVAAVLIDHNLAFEDAVIELKDKFYKKVDKVLSKQKEQLSSAKTKLFGFVDRAIKDENTRLKDFKSSFLRLAGNKIKSEKERLEKEKSRIFKLAGGAISISKERLSNAKNIVKLSDPQVILNKGFAIVECNGKVVTDSSQVNIGSELKITLKQGSITGKNQYNTQQWKTRNYHTAMLLKS
jgi:exodeoxyribonuclease VII large subunit